eukprot:58665_1
MTHVNHVLHNPLQEFTFPPPIKLSWKLTDVPSYCVLEPVKLDVSTTIDTKCEQQTDTHCDQLQTSSVNCDDHRIRRTLAQYGNYTNYRIYSRVLMHGFVRDLQSHITSIIPTDIITMCLLFYFEEANDSIHLAHALFKHIHRKPVGGAKVLSILSDSLPSKCDRDNSQILRDLVHFQFIRIVSRKSTFSRWLMHMNETADLASELCTYQFMDNVSDEFDQYSKFA